MESTSTFCAIQPCFERPCGFSVENNYFLLSKPHFKISSKHFNINSWMKTSFASICFSIFCSLMAPRRKVFSTGKRNFQLCVSTYGTYFFFLASTSMKVWGTLIVLLTLFDTGNSSSVTTFSKETAVNTPLISTGESGSLMNSSLLSHSRLTNSYINNELTQSSFLQEANNITTLPAVLFMERTGSSTEMTSSAVFWDSQTTVTLNPGSPPTSYSSVHFHFTSKKLQSEVVSESPPMETLSVKTFCISPSNIVSKQFINVTSYSSPPRSLASNVQVSSKDSIELAPTIRQTPESLISTIAVSNTSSRWHEASGVSVSQFRSAFITTQHTNESSVTASVRNPLSGLLSMSDLSNLVASFWTTSTATFSSNYRRNSAIINSPVRSTSSLLTALSFSSLLQQYSPTQDASSELVVSPSLESSLSSVEPVMISSSIEVAVINSASLTSPSLTTVGSVTSVSSFISMTHFLPSPSPPPTAAQQGTSLGSSLSLSLPTLTSAHKSSSLPPIRLPEFLSTSTLPSSWSLPPQSPRASPSPSSSSSSFSSSSSLSSSSSTTTTTTTATRPSPTSTRTTSTSKSASVLLSSVSSLLNLSSWISSLPQSLPVLPAVSSPSPLNTPSKVTSSSSSPSPLRSSSLLPLSPSSTLPRSSSLRLPSLSPPPPSSSLQAASTPSPLELQSIPLSSLTPSSRLSSPPLSPSSTLSKSSLSTLPPLSSPLPSVSSSSSSSLSSLSSTSSLSSAVIISSTAFELSVTQMETSAFIWWSNYSQQKSSTLLHSSMYYNAISQKTSPFIIFVTPSEISRETLTSFASSSIAHIPPTTSPQDESRVINLTFSVLNEVFDTDLKNESSEKFKNLSRGVTSTLWELFNLTVEGLMTIKILHFSEGSVKVDSQLIVSSFSNVTTQNVSQTLLSRNGSNSQGFIFGQIVVKETCTRGYCRNSASCQEGAVGATCSCSTGFVGARCTQVSAIAVNGKYTEWSEFSVCSKTCDRGKKSRTRSCTNPPPRNGGKDCSGLGPDKEYADCNADIRCPVSTEIWIAVGISCGAFLIILILLVLLFLRRRRKKAQENNRSMDIYNSNGHTIPLEVIYEDKTIPKNAPKGHLNPEFIGEDDDDNDIYKAQLLLFLKQSHLIRANVPLNEQDNKSDKSDYSRTNSRRVSALSTASDKDEEEDDKPRVNFESASGQTQHGENGLPSTEL